MHEAPLLNGDNCIRQISSQQSDDRILATPISWLIRHSDPKCRLQSGNHRSIRWIAKDQYSNTSTSNLERGGIHEQRRIRWPVVLALSAIGLCLAASWCIDCQREAPLLVQLHQRHPELAIVMVDSNEDRAKVQAFVREFNIVTPVDLDTDGKVMQQYRIMAIPTDLFLDGEGVIRGRIIESVSSRQLMDTLRTIGVEP
jgi:thiol-disulfide isomerase/thioredoxin